MNVRKIGFWLVVVGLPMYLGCDARVTIRGDGTAAIVGTIGDSGSSGKYAALAQLGCPDVIVRLNNNLVNVDLDDDCTFLIDDVQPAANVDLSVELPDLGVSGTISLDNVVASEFIEIFVETDDDFLAISVVRRAAPDPVDTLPLVVTDNNVTILIPAGTYNQSLTVDGNNFTLVGVAGTSCDSSGWSTITGDVFIQKNNATFRNIRFDGVVEVSGNNAHFINSCFGSDLFIFGNGADFDDDADDGEDGENNDGGEDDDDDGGGRR